MKARRIQPTGFEHQSIVKMRTKTPHAKLCLIRAALAVGQPYNPHGLSKALGVRITAQEIAEAKKKRFNNHRLLP